MTKVRKQILDVTKIVYEHAKLNPENSPFQLTIDHFAGYPNFAAVLDKLERQYKVIEIQQRPDERGLSDADLGMFQTEQPRNFEKYMSYFIVANPSFDEFYQKHYAENSVNIPSLKRDNFFLVIDTADLIDDIINVNASNEIIIEAGIDGRFKHHYKGPESSWDVTRKAKQVGLDFLKSLNAIASYQPVIEEYYDFGKENEYLASYKVEVNRHIFHEVYHELLTYLDKHLGSTPEAEGMPVKQKHAISFDEANGKLRDGQEALDVTEGSIEFYMLKALFAKKAGTATNLEDIVEEWGGQERKQTVYDAVSRLNTKFRRLLHTNDKSVKLVYQKAAKLYLDAKYSDSISTQK